MLACSCSPARADRNDHARALSFEACGEAGDLSLWNTTRPEPPGVLELDSTVVHGGRWSGRITRAPGTTSFASSLSLRFPADIAGDSIELSGWLKSEGVVGRATLWMRLDGRSPVSFQFGDLGDRALKGTSGWSRGRISLAIDPRARNVFVGAMLQGEGRAWFDDLEIRVDGRPLAAARERVLEKTVLDTDTTFLTGSGVTLSNPTAEQADRLALLGRVWGFLKYHHPAIVAGRRHWDFDLFRILPRVLADSDRAAALDAIADWIDALGTIEPCSPCAPDPAGRPLVARLEWLSDRTLLGSAVSERLRHVYANRPRAQDRFFVSTPTRVGNPDFGGEAHYPDLVRTDPGYRLLSLFRYWNIIEYWFPYRDVMGEDWNAVLREFIPPVMAAPSDEDFFLAMLQVVERVHDGHANLRSTFDARPPLGRGMVPVVLRHIEGRPVVTGYSNALLGPASGLEIGDVLLAIDGVVVDTLLARWRRYYPASNEASRYRDLMRALPKGPPGIVTLRIDRKGALRDLATRRVLSDSLDLRAGLTHDHPGPAFRRISREVAYLKLSSVKASEVSGYLDGASGAKLLVIDIRNYPSEFMVFALGQHLVDRETPFASFTRVDPSNPGSFQWDQPIQLVPESPRFSGRVAVLIDESSQSQSEYTSMAFRTAPGAIVVGSQTAGADGNVSPMVLPGRLSTSISGIGVYYPNHRPTQRIGIVPDLEVRPTLAGIRAGRDEVLEAAIRAVLGRSMSTAEYEAIRGEPGHAGRSSP